MATYQAAYHETDRVVTVQEDGSTIPAETVNIGTFEHPDPIYPGSSVVYHAVRDLLYKVSHADASQEAMFPENITDMHNISIELDPVIDPVPVTHVEMVTDEAEVEVEGTLQLDWSVFPTNASNKNVSFTTSDPAVATVNSDGLVTGVGAGDATITVTTDDGEFTDNTVITVTPEDVPDP